MLHYSSLPTNRSEKLINLLLYNLKIVVRASWEESSLRYNNFGKLVNLRIFNVGGACAANRVNFNLPPPVFKTRYQIRYLSGFILLRELGQALGKLC